MTTLARYDAACAALAAAVKADEVMAVRLEARAIEAVAKVAKNLDLEIQAHQLRTRAEVRLGEMMLEAEEKGYLARRGGQPKARDEGSDSEPSIRAKLREIGVDKKLSARAKRLGGIGQQAVEVMLTRMRAESIKRGRIASDIIANELAGRSAESRRALARELSEASKPLSPSGQKVPVLYADPAWQRKAGIGNRAYENHYGTMAWEDILAMPVAKRLLPDAWGFIWIPRAHLLALVETEVDTPLGRCRMKIPLAWAIQIKWGFDSYSTCAVWTKTDEECPDDHGTGLIFWDQDELLLVFKRGNGLPKPDSAKKFGSNYRARAGRHSEKPAFYRDMINAMTGGLPVLELFAREDDEHVLPANFITWGNQSRNTANAVSCETSADSNLPPHDPETGEVIDDNDGVRNAPEGGISVLPGEGDDLDIPEFLRRKAS